MKTFSLKQRMSQSSFSAVKAIFISVYLLFNHVCVYAYEMQDAAYMNFDIDDHYKRLKDFGIEAKDIPTVSMEPLKINNVLIPTFRQSMLDATKLDDAPNREAVLKILTTFPKHTCTVKSFSFSSIPNPDTLKKLSAYCFYDTDGTQIWSLAPKNWNVKMADEGMDGGVTIIFAPQNEAKITTQWEFINMISACQGCIISEAAKFYPSLNTPKNAGDISAENLKTDVPVKQVVFKSGAVGFSYVKPAHAFPTNGLIRVSGINTDHDMFLREVLITLPEKEIDVAKAILNNN